MKLLPVRLRFGMRAALVAMTICCLVAAWQVSQYKARKRLIADIRAAGGAFGVAIEGPKWLRRRVGDDEYFYEPVRISFGTISGETVAHSNELNEVLRACRALDRLEVLDLRGSAIDDKGLALVADIPSVRILRLSNTAITDIGLERLRALPRVESIWVGGTRVSDAAIERFQRTRPGCKLTRER